MLSPSRFAALASALFLAGCGHVPVSTMWALRNFDGAERRSGFSCARRCACRERFSPGPGGVKVVATWGKKGDPASEQKVEIVLRGSEPVCAEGPALAKENLPGKQSARVSRRARRCRAPARPAGRDRAGEGREAGRPRLARHGRDACRTGDLPDGPILMTTFLKMSDETGWLTVLKNVDLRTLVARRTNRSRRSRRRVASCPSAWRRLADGLAFGRARQHIGRRRHSISP